MWSHLTKLVSSSHGFQLYFESFVINARRKLLPKLAVKVRQRRPTRSLRNEPHRIVGRIVEYQNRAMQTQSRHSFVRFLNLLTHMQLHCWPSREGIYTR